MKMRRLPSTPKAKDKVFIDGFWSAYHQMCGILRKSGIVQLHLCSHVIENFYLHSLFLTDGILTQGFGSHQAVTGSFFLWRPHYCFCPALNQISGANLRTHIDQWSPVWNLLETSKDPKRVGVSFTESCAPEYLAKWKQAQEKPARRLLQSSQKPFREEAPVEEFAKAEGKPSLAATGEFSLNDIPNRAPWEG